MSKHTAGRWQYLDKSGRFIDSKGWEVENYHCDDYSFVPVTDGKDVVALVVTKGDDEKTLADNAKLIAAAPELLEALELADSLLAGANMNKDLVEKKVKAAIAKVRGEA